SRRPAAAIDAPSLHVALPIFTVGQRLIIPAADRIEAGAATATVGLGGSLDQIAARYRIPVEDLARLNRIANPAGLPAGQEVAVRSEAHTSELQSRGNLVSRLP